MFLQQLLLGTECNTLGYDQAIHGHGCDSNIDGASSHQVSKLEGYAIGSFSSAGFFSNERRVDEAMWRVRVSSCSHNTFVVNGTAVLAYGDSDCLGCDAELV